MINDVNKARLWHHRRNRFFWGADGFIYFDLTNVDKCHIVCTHETTRRDFLTSEWDKSRSGKIKNIWQCIFKSALRESLEKLVMQRRWSGFMAPLEQAAGWGQCCGWKRNTSKFSFQQFPMGNLCCLRPLHKDITKNDLQNYHIVNPCQNSFTLSSAVQINTSQGCSGGGRASSGAGCALRLGEQSSGCTESPSECLSSTQILGPCIY